MLKIIGLDTKTICELDDKKGSGCSNVSYSINEGETASLSFNFPFKNKKKRYIKNGLYVLYEGETYEIQSVVKDTTPDSNLLTVSCLHRSDGLTNKFIVEQYLDPSNAITQMNIVLVGTGWTIGTVVTEDVLRGFEFSRETVFEALTTIAETFNAFLYFSVTIEDGQFIHSVSLIDRTNEIPCARYFVNKETIQLNSEDGFGDFITRLYCFGGTNPITGLAVDLIDATVNGSLWGKTYVENYSYYLDQGITQGYIDSHPAQFLKEDIWESSDYVDPDTLYTDAVARLEKLSRPTLNLKLQKIFITHGIPNIGYNVELIDEEDDISYLCHVGGISTNSEEPKTCELTITNSSVIKNIWKRIMKSSNKIANITTNGGYLKPDAVQDGSITIGKLSGDVRLNQYPVGSIYTSKLLDIPDDLFGGVWERMPDTLLVTDRPFYPEGLEEDTKATSVEVILSRPSTAITDQTLWQESIVSANTPATITSIAVRKAGKNPDKIFVAYISEGTLYVKSATFSGSLTNSTWTIEKTIPNCIGCSIAFNGSFIHNHQSVEYRTELTPWLLYLTSAGELKVGLINGSFETLVSSNVTSVDLSHGVSSYYKDIDQGLIAFYIISGVVYYRQLVANVWLGQESIPIAPANAVSLKASRLFDYRNCVQVVDNTGALYEVFTKMEASGWNGTEYISAALSVQSVLIPISFRDYQSADEYITASLSLESVILYALSPVMSSSDNINDGLGNFGLQVNLAWDENIFGEEAGRFVISDGYSGAWGGQSITKNGKVLTITFMDFNNAINPVTLTYTQGTMMGDVVAVANDSIEFTADGLIPNNLPKPSAVMAENIDEIQIIVSFDMLVASANWAGNVDAFTVTAQEYDMIPNGTAYLKTYVVNNVTEAINPTKILITLTDAGRIKYPIGNVTVAYAKAYGNLTGELGGQVDNFAIDFASINIDEVFNPNDVEYISAALSVSSDLMQIYYEDYKLDEYISAALSVTTQIIHVNDIPQ